MAIVMSGVMYAQSNTIHALNIKTAKDLRSFFQYTDQDVTFAAPPGIIVLAYIYV